MRTKRATKTTRMSEREGRIIRASYDGAQTSADNRRHWVAADALSAEAANSLAVRKLLRQRASYEASNNSFLDGILDTLANDTFATGPRLQMLTDNDEANTIVEEEFKAWALEIGLAQKLRVMRRARAERGEVFLVWAYNPGLESEVKLDINLVEADQVTDPTWQSISNPYWCDGINYDVYGNPISYRLLKQHPGSSYFLGANPLDFEDVPARFVFHYFLPKRPGQRRGVPEITSALSNWPELRRYCDAVIAAAETAADYAMTIESNAPANNQDDDSTEDAEAMDEIELRKRMATFLPRGYRMSQTRAEQPTTTYPSFVDKKLAEAARCIQMPFTIAALDSSQSNLAARYLDSQIYAKAIKVERHDANKPLNRTLDLWLNEALKIPGYLPALPIRLRRQWYWPSIGQHADPDKVAKGQSGRLANGTSCIPDECAEDGNDWEEVQMKQARALGLSIEEFRKRLADAFFNNGSQPAQQSAEEENEGQEETKPKQ